jgi:hypothetical protein
MLLKMLAWWLKTNLHANLINLLNNIISSKEFVNRHRLQKNAFTRNRSLPFKLVILFLINLLKSSIQNELDKFFRTINHSELPKRVVTNSALTQARKKFSHKAYIELDKAQIKYFYDNENHKKWNGLRLVAIDGSTLIVPKNEETIQQFGQFSHSSKTTPVVMARVSQAYDTLNKISLDSIISPLSIGELDLATSHINSAQKDDLYLFDRGYNAFWLFSMVLSKGSKFCARIKIPNWKAAGELIESGLNEKIYKIFPSQKSRLKLKALGLPLEPIEVRFVVIRLENGDKYVLATSLTDLEKYPYELFEDLYPNRWPIEESYKTVKSRIEMENFTGKSVEAVKQDFHARVFTCNLTTILSFSVNEKVGKDKKKKYNYQINFTQALAKMKDSVVILFVRENIQKIIQDLQEHFFNNREPVRPNRKFPRIPKPKKHYYMAYKPVS